MSSLIDLSEVAGGDFRYLLLKVELTLNRKNIEFKEKKKLKILEVAIGIREKRGRRNYHRGHRGVLCGEIGFSDELERCGVKLWAEVF